MKTFTTILLVVLCCAGLSRTVRAQTYTLSVSIAADPVDLEGVADPVSFGAGEFGQTLLSNLPQGQPRSTVHNRGYATIDYTVAAHISEGAWSLGSSAGLNTAVLFAIFTRPLRPSEDAASGKTLTAGDFGPEDRLSATPLLATATVLAQNSETDPNFKGYNALSIQSYRSLRYRLDLPTGGGTDPQTIVVVIGAVVR
ncbi:MAG: hypothetical protein V2A34_10800 [Lentisphaerota bacterium]